MSHKRMLIWRHNGLQGKLAMASRAMEDICSSSTVHEDQKREADALRRRINNLAYEIRTNRVGP